MRRFKLSYPFSAASLMGGLLIAQCVSAQSLSSTELNRRSAAALGGFTRDVANTPAPTPPPPPAPSPKRSSLRSDVEQLKRDFTGTGNSFVGESVGSDGFADDPIAGE